MKRLIPAQQACKVIEDIVSDDFCQDCECKAAWDEPFSQEDARFMAQKLTTIYTLTHGIDTDHSCYSVHTGWREDLKRRYRRIRRNQIRQAPEGVRG